MAGTTNLPYRDVSFSRRPRAAFSVVGARGIEPRYSCSQGTRITGFLDAVQFGEKESNLHHLGQGQAAYRLADPRMSDTSSR